MSRFKILSILLCSSLLLTSCARREKVDAAPDFGVSVDVIPSPPQVGPALLMITIAPQGADLPGDFTIDVRGDMSHAGMAPVIVEAVEGEMGIYPVPFEWTMAGDWFINISATLPDGRILLRTLPVQVAP